MSLSLAFAAALILSGQDGPMVTAPTAPTETAEALRTREAMAYAYPTPPGVPADDFGFLNYCHGLIDGHVQLGETLGTAADAELMRLGRLEAADFRAGLAAARDRQSPETLAAAEAAAAERNAVWETALAREDEADRSQVFGLFFGLPGRCEHAARRLRDNITTPPATPEDVGLE